MRKTPNMLPLKELNLTSRFLFDEVMEDPQAQQILPGAYGYFTSGTGDSEL